MTTTRFLPVLLFACMIGSVLAGCLSSDLDPDGGDGEQGDPTRVPAEPVWQDGFLEIDVPVPVLMVGFSTESVERLREFLEDGERVAQYTSTLNQPLPPDPDRGVGGHIPLEGEAIPMPIIPTARYEVVDLGETFADILAEKAAAWSVEGTSALEGRLLEDWLVAQLAGTPHQPDPGAPSLVVIREDVTDRTWRYTFPHGWLEPVQSFGERESIHVRVVASDDDVSTIDHTVRELTHYRFLQGSVYPMPVPECHAITLITAYRPTSLAEHLPEFENAVDLLDVDALSRAFSNLTGTTVHVDSKVLQLPVDDPVLDLIVRGEFGTMEAQRAWFTLNWQDYWVAHEGCEPYLSFLVHGDLASAGTGIIGIGTYAGGDSYRIALSWVNEAFRLLWDPASPINQNGDESGSYNWINYLHAHEAGHILGMNHPFHIMHEGGVASNRAFQDVWSAMSYSTDGRVIDFSMVDRANFQRNSAAFLLKEASESGLEGSPEWGAAMERLSVYDWNGASAQLWPSVQESRDR